MTQTLYFITQNGQPISMETWMDRGLAQDFADKHNRECQCGASYEVRSRISSDKASKVPAALIAFALLLSGCAARKPYAGPQWHGPWPKGIDCGVPTKFDDGSQWIFPCWPEKNEPRCVSGCDNASEATPIPVRMGL